MEMVSLCLCLSVQLMSVAELALPAAPVLNGAIAPLLEHAWQDVTAFSPVECDTLARAILTLNFMCKVRSVCNALITTPISLSHQRTRSTASRSLQNDITTSGKMSSRRTSLCTGPRVFTRHCSSGGRHCGMWPACTRHTI